MLHPKQVSFFLGKVKIAPLVLQPFPTFGRSGRHRPVKMATVLGPTEEFWKKLVLVIWLGLCGTDLGLTFLFRIPQTRCRTRDLRWIFQNVSARPSTVAIFTWRWRPNCPKSGNDYIKGGRLSLSPKNNHFNWIQHLMEILILLAHMI